MNYLRWSEDFKNWVNGWSDNSEQGIDFNNGVSTKGTYLTELETFAPHYLLSEYMELPLGWYTFSVYVKAAERSKIRLKSSNTNVFDLDFTYNIGALYTEGSLYIDILDDDWYRIGISGEVLDTKMFRVQLMIIDDNDQWEFFGTKDEGLYIYGAQLEEAATDVIASIPGTYTHTIGYTQ